MKKIVIIGAGGCGREAAELLLYQHTKEENFTIEGFIDDNTSLHGKQISNLTVLGDWNWLEKADRHTTSVVCAIGFPEPRKIAAARAAKLGFSFANVISPQAYISPRANVGKGVIIFPFTYIDTSVKIGDHSIVYAQSFVGHDTTISNLITVCPGVNIAGNVSVGEGCWIGIGSSIIQGRTIGEWTFLGAGSVVVKDIPSRVLAVGNPAKAIKTR